MLSRSGPSFIVSYHFYLKKSLSSTHNDHYHVHFFFPNEELANNLLQNMQHTTYEQAQLSLFSLSKYDTFMHYAIDSPPNMNLLLNVRKFIQRSPEQFHQVLEQLHYNSKPQRRIRFLQVWRGRVEMAYDILSFF